MDGYQSARFAYLALLGAALVGYYFLHNRDDWSKVARHAALWVLIFVGAVAGYGLWNDFQASLMPRQAVLDSGAIEVPRGPDGHFYVTAQVNGLPVDFVIDTGATDVVLTRADAARVGIDPASLAYTGTASTANGNVATAATRVRSLGLGGVIDRNLRVYVNKGQMDISLLGMDYLRRFKKIEIVGGRMVLTR